MPGREPRGAIGLLLLCALLWSLNGPLIKQLTGAHGLSGLSIAIWRSLFAGAALLPFCHEQLGKLPRTRWWAVAVLAFAAMCGLFVSATAATEASNAIILQYTAPCWIFLLGPLLLHERAAPRDLLVLMAAMLGVGIIFLAQFKTASVGLLLGLASGLAFAFVVLSLRRLRDADALATPCVLNLATAALLAPCALLWPAPMPGSATAWMLLILMGVVQMALPYWLMALALRRASAATAALVTLAEPLLNTLWTLLTHGERPRQSTLVGGGCILAALLLKQWLDLRGARRPAASSG